VKDKKGKMFDVLFRLVAVDKTSRTAFVWRFLPRATIVKTT
jgi:hypothetical protein